MKFALSFETGDDARQAVKTINLTFNEPARHEGSALVIIDTNRETAANFARHFKYQGYYVDLHTYEFDRAYQVWETGELINVLSAV